VQEKRNGYFSKNGSTWYSFRLKHYYNSLSRVPGDSIATHQQVNLPGSGTAARHLLRQYRHAAGGWLWELPAGKMEADESPQATAERELIEEAGLEAGRWDTLGKVIVSPGFCDEVIHLYLARDLTVVPAQPEEDELFEVHWIAFERALQQVYDGTLLDAKTMLGLTLAEKHIQT
jgi:8-oxo-dGTP pyrophosphatase MutT (NUDIX family)